MPDLTKILKYIENSEDRKDLELLVKRARDRGEKEVAEAAFRKLISIVPGALPGSIEHDFWSTIHAFEHILSNERGKTVRLSRTRQKVERVGIIQTLTDWAFGKETQGFDMLIEREMPELTGEAIITRHADRFPNDVVASARDRLRKVGYDMR